MRGTYGLKLAALTLVVCAVLVVMFTGSAVNPSARAFSTGPPAGHTNAPGEFNCDECHVTTDAGTGKLIIEAPQTYVPGETYKVTVRQTNVDTTRIRWGFQLTALDTDNQRAGRLASTDAFTQVLDNQGPFPGRQYVEHTEAGTFEGQTGSASWTFDWTAPETDVGPVTFYAAGNQANGDRNTSGDNVYFTFVVSTPGTAAPDFSVSVSPAARSVTPTNGVASYTVTVSPSGGFNGPVALSVRGLPPGATATLNPATVQLSGSAPVTSVLTVLATNSTPLGSFSLNVAGAGGGLTRAASATLNVISAASADISVATTASPSPAVVGSLITYTVVVANRGPSKASGVVAVNSLPAGVSFESVLNFNGSCSVNPGQAGPDVECRLEDIEENSSKLFTITVRAPRAAGLLANRARAVSLTEDPDASNNAATLTTLVEEPNAGPRMTVPDLSVRPVVTGLDLPTSLAFLGADDFLVLEKNTGRVRRVRNGALQSPDVLDLAVNNASERGLLGVALHPNFPANNFVYLYWTWRGAGDGPDRLLGADTSDIIQVALMGNRVDRFRWDGTRLTFDRNVVTLRALQTDAGGPRGNHDGGVLRFGPDGKLYVVVGDVGRRGFMQNVLTGVGPDGRDDEFGGPEPDDEHFTGVILRLNDDGTPPADNPFARAADGFTGEVADNLRKLYAYGVRNSFGMDFDPVSGKLWAQENGDDAFDELNRVEPGMNGGWIQLMGPAARVAQYREIEVSRGGGLQQARWPPTLIASNPTEAAERLFQIQGSHYRDPEFSWKFAVAPSPVGFARGAGLGAEYANDLFVGASRTTLLGGYLFRFDLTADRLHVASPDTRLADRVADNRDKFDLTESETLVVGRDFGITTDIQTGPDGRLYVVSLSNGAVYQISSRPPGPRLYVARLSGAEFVPPTDTNASGVATLLLSPDETSALVTIEVRGENFGDPKHIHGPAPPGANAPVIIDFGGPIVDHRITLTPAQVAQLKAGLWYVDAHPHRENNSPGIRGQLVLSPTASVFDFVRGGLGAREPGRSGFVQVVRRGDLSTPASVEVFTSDGTATARGDYTPAFVRLDFAPGERVKSFDVVITDDVFPEPVEEFFNLTLANPAGDAGLGSPVTVPFFINDEDFTQLPQPNPLDDARFFVRQHYADFLNRPPDDAGLAFWTSQITECGANASCVDVRRQHVSAAFFLSIEFQETGVFVYRLYKTAFNRRPLVGEFLRDTQELGRGVVVGVGDWQARLEQNRARFLARFVEREEFKSASGALTDAQYADRLIANAGLTPAEAGRDALVSGLSNGTESRVTVLRKLADNEQFKRNQRDRAFVFMQYIGYLRRDPDEAGFQFWLQKLLNHHGDFVSAEMVRSFLVSGEYRGRFGP